MRAAGFVSARVVAPALLASAALAACGGASSTGSPSAVTVTDTTTVTTPATSTATTTGTGASSTASTTTTSTSTTAAVPACTASTLALLYQGSNGALGTLALYFALRNTGTVACHTYGYPGVLFMNASGAALPTSATRSTHDPLGDTPVSSLVIAPGKTVGFRLIANDAAESGSGTGCGTAAYLQAIAPDDTATMRVRLAGGVPECGHATLSPLMPGSAIPPGT
jgi:hypothetical protein